MRRFATIAACTATLTLSWILAAAPSAPAAVESSSGASTQAPAPDRIVVEWQPGVPSGDRVQARADADTTFLRTLGTPAFQLVRPESGQTVGEALDALRADPTVRVAVRDGYSVLNAATNDPLFSQLWGLDNLGLGVNGFVGAIAGADINATAAWDRTRGSSTVVIADIDSGYRFDAPDLAPVAWTNPADPSGGGDDDANGIVDDSHGADFVGGNAQSPTTDGDPTDDNIVSGGHGVHTAGTMGAAGNNGVGISGVVQNVRIMPLRVCANDPTTNDALCPYSSQILAINYAGSHGARAANMSLGGTTVNTAVRDAIASNPQTLFVISAGNDTQDNDLTPHYPCAYDPTTSGIGGAIDNIVCVAATDQADGLASFSDWGHTSVDLGAPGTETLSTYPVKEVRFGDDFEADTFAATWSNTGGSGFGRAGAGDGPLTSFGMTDSPGAAPAPGSLHEVTLTTGAAIPAGYGSCVLSGRRYRSGGSGGTFSYSVLSDDVSVFLNSSSTATSGSAMQTFSTAPLLNLAGHAVKVRFDFTAGSSPTSANGIWIDDLKLTCNAPLATPPTYDYLEGTSMAAPHVTGAAGLLFSLKPSATVTEVRDALLAGVDPDPALAGKTMTGGRLDVFEAMAALVPPSPPPPVVVPPVVPPPAVAPPVVKPPVRCLVPALAGKTLTQATKALKQAHCKLGTVTKPKVTKGHAPPPLVVASSSPRAGKVLAESAKVKLTLKAKPKRPVKHRH